MSRMLCSGSKVIVNYFEHTMRKRDFQRTANAQSIVLTLKAPITTSGLDISYESSAWQTIHMKYQDLFSLKKKKKRMSSDCINDDPRLILTYFT